MDNELQEIATKYARKPLPTSLKKDSDRMKHDMTTYKDRENKQIGMTADHTSRPDKVLFFADPHFLFYKANTQQTHFVFPTAPAQKPKKQKEFAFLSAQNH